MSLLRQWPVLEAVLMPTLMLLRPVERLVVWNFGCLDDALAVALLYFHCRLDQRVGDLRVFHSGPTPGFEPLRWRPADIRGVPRGGWVVPAGDRPGRWAPDRRVMEKVVLGSPAASVLPDVLVVPGFGSISGSAGGPLARLRTGGLLVLGEPAPRTPFSPEQVEPVDGGGRLFRKLAPAADVPDTGAEPVEDRTLARHDEEAHLVESYMSLAKALARRFAHRGERPEDLEQVAALALIRAAGRYSAEVGGFGTFATTSIVGELKRHFRDRMWAVRLPRSLQERHLEIRAARDELAQTHGCSPTIAQIAGYLGTSEEAVLAAMEAAENCWPSSLDAPRGDSEDSVVDVPVQEAGFERSLDRWLLQESIPGLSATEQLIIRRLYFDGHSQRQVAEEIGVSQMQVSRILARILAKLRRSLMPA